MSEKFREQEHKWQTKLYVMTQQHKEELEQVSDTSSVSVSVSVHDFELS